MVTNKGILAFGEPVGISASLVRQSSAKLLFSSADNILSLFKSPAYSDLGSGNFFKYLIRSCSHGWFSAV